MTRQPASNGLPLPLAPGLWRVITGFIVWAVAFVTLYVGHALGCVYVSPVQAVTVFQALIVLWLPSLLLCAALAWRSGRRWKRLRAEHAARGRVGLAQTDPCSASSTVAQSSFLWRTTFLIDVGALAAVLIIVLPVFTFRVCAL